MTARLCHPGILQVGKIDGAGAPRGWTMTRCAAQCNCHVQPLTHNLVLFQDDVRKEIGLRRFRDCGCCTSWRFSELGAFLRDLAAIGALDVGAPS